MHQDATWYGGRPQPKGLCVRWGPSPYRKGGVVPQFSAHVYCGQTAAWIKMPFGLEVDLGPGDFVLDGYPAPLPKKGAEPPKFSAHVYCGQTAGWIKIVLGTEVGLSPGDLVVLDEDPAPSPKRGQSPLANFRPISIVAKRLDASIFGRPFVKRFALCYRTVVCPVCLGRWCIVAKRFHGSR